MPDSSKTIVSDLFEREDESTAHLALTVTFEIAQGCVSFVWMGPANAAFAKGRLSASELSLPMFVLQWKLEWQGRTQTDACNAWPSSTRALVRRIRKQFPLAPDAVRFGLLSDMDLGKARAGEWFPIDLPAHSDPWKWLGGQVQQMAQLLDSNAFAAIPLVARQKKALTWLACSLLHVAPPLSSAVDSKGNILSDLRVSFNELEYSAEFLWTGHGMPGETIGRIRASPNDKLRWDLEIDGQHDVDVTSHQRSSIRDVLAKWLERFPTNRNTFRVYWVSNKPGSSEKVTNEVISFGPDENPYLYLEENIAGMAAACRIARSPLAEMIPGDVDPLVEFERFDRKLMRKEERRAQAEAELQERMRRVAEERRLRERERNEQARRASVKSTPPAPSLPVKPRTEVPPVAVHLAIPPLAFQETSFPLENLQTYFLRERAALWWVSNQSDDLVCLPHCRIERLEYQVRTALRVLGPLRGRALLSDEVGLGKTIESGLVIKELLTRGMVKRFLVLTVPSLVDQWEEELSDKFGLSTATTNHSSVRDDPQHFWTENSAIVASLHTLKQPAHLEAARQVQWDILIVDEAHYLRNRESRAWQAVNVLPRRFLLLLTATPVQNSLEDLYNLVTLLQPGQLPSPKEFRARFIDPKRPRQPKEPEELRRLLGQVMIRNTRANAGIQLPPRRAETVLFYPDELEAAFWSAWESEFRVSLSHLNPGQSSLWGRLVLQAAGSSPAAWRGALEKFPDRAASKIWRDNAPLESSWKKKCDLIPPITRTEGGVVIFTQFLETQRAIAEFLRAAQIDTFVINGSVPAAERQGITEEFRKCGGALLLTHSGTEGRNLQFSHRLINFDLPWNPMEIEQRIGRLHRLGQKHPVRIYNLVQAGTLQEHLLEILQEKLNLFELVVGETGLILGDRFGSDEFAEEILRRWRESDGRVAESLATLGTELAAARDQYGEIKKLDDTLFAKDYESL